MEQYEDPKGIKEFNDYRVVLHTMDDHPTWPSQDSWELRLIDRSYSERVYVMECAELQKLLDGLRTKLKEAESQINTLNTALQARDQIIDSLNESIRHTNEGKT